MKKACLTMTLLLCTIIASATAIFNGQGQGTASSPYEIWNYDRLNDVLNFVGDEGNGVYFRLEVDIDLAKEMEGLPWQPIGSQSEPFMGVFLGNGHKITGMKINSTANNQGFFGYVNDATIKDLTIEGTVSGGNYVGGIVGGGFCAITNCTFNGDATGSGSYVGGIAGELGGNMTNLSHTGITQGQNYVGGIVGNQSYGSMNSITNAGEVTGNQYVGGLAGNSLKDISVTNSSAYGNVTGTSWTGGLIGFKEGGSVSGCTTQGTVSGAILTGGLIGEGTCSVSNSRHTSGNISGTNYVGGLVGKLSSGDVTECYIYADITGLDYVGGVVGCYELSSTVSQAISTSGFFGNINGQSSVGGILGQVSVFDNTSTTAVSAPTLHTYKTYNDLGAGNQTYTETIKDPKYINVSISNCATVGNIIGTGNNIGGILGKGFRGEKIVKTTYTATAGYYNSAHESLKTTISGFSYHVYFYYVDGKEYRVTLHDGSINFKYYDYTYVHATTSVTDNYFSGNLKGADYVGGVVGYILSGDIERNHSYAAITGTNQVGGILGFMQAGLKYDSYTPAIASNVQLNSSITASSNGGKIYGGVFGSYYTVATSGSTINKSLNTTALVVNGVTQETYNEATAQNGTPQIQRQLLQTTSYSGLGWNFDAGKEWTSEESVTYPYKQWQTAPPTIKTGATSGSTTIGSTCKDDGKVYVTIDGNSTVYEATCSGGTWTATTPQLNSGVLIRAWSTSADKEQSYQTSITADFPGSGTEADPWRIYTAYDLKGVNKAGHYKMMNDVDLTSWINANSASEGWPGVGSNNEDALTFDGDGHTVTGLWCNTTTTLNGLFSTLKNATIKNLTVEVASGKQMKGGNYTAILAGQLTNSTITNITVKGSASATAGRVAGMIGRSSGNTISECKVSECTITTSKGINIGGMLAYSSGDNISNCQTNVTIITSGTTFSTGYGCGGLAGCLTNCTVSDCSVQGTINVSEEEAPVGSIAGLAYNGCSLTRCKSNVAITATGDDAYVGGLVGECNNTSISLCFSENAITASGSGTYVGGIVGYNYANGTISNCFSTCDMTGTGSVGGIVGYNLGSISKCVATGSLKNTSDDGYAGGIAGYMEESKAFVTACVGLCKRIETGSNMWGYRIIGGTGNNINRPEIADNSAWVDMPILRNNARKNVIDDPYEGTAKTTEELMQQATYTALGWDFTDVWGIHEGNGFPYLFWVGSSDVTVEKTPLTVTANNLTIDAGTAIVTDVFALNIDNDEGLWGWGDGYESGFVDDGSYNGTKCFYATSPASGEGWTTQLAMGFNPLVVGQEYVLHFWAKATDNFNTSAHIRYNDEAAGYPSRGDFGEIAFTKDWQEYTFTTTITGEDANMLIINIGGLAGTVYFDNISLTAKNPTLTLSYDGFKDNDTEATAFVIRPIATTKATSKTIGGKFPIYVSGGVSPKYEPTYVQGTLTIMPQQTEDMSYYWMSGLEKGGTATAQDGESVGLITRGYTTIRLNNKKDNVDTEGYVDVALDEPLQAGDEIRITAFRYSDTDRIGTIYFKYGNGTVVDDEYLFPNAHPNYGQEPCEHTWTVSDEAAGSQTIRLTRGESGTQVLITQIIIVRGNGTETPNTDNTLAGKDLSAKKNSQAELEIVLNNHDVVRLCQFDLTLPEGVTVAKNAKDKYIITLTDRAEYHRVSADLLSNSDYRVIISSPDNDDITGNDGTLAKVTLNIAENMADGEYNIQVKNIVLSLPDGNNLNKVKPADVTSKLTINSYKPGDADGDGEVDVNDVGCTINYILEQVPDVFVFEAADMDHDQTIDVNDVGYIINTILGLYNPVRSYIPEMAIGNTGTQESTITAVAGGYDLAVPQADRYVACQFDVTLPAGTTLDGIRLNAQATADHSVTFREMADGSYRVVVYSLTGSAFTDAGGTLLTVQTAGCDVIIRNVIFSTTTLSKVRMGDLSATATGIADASTDMKVQAIGGGRLLVTANSETTLSVTTLGGASRGVLNVKQGTSVFGGFTPGVYFINNKKIVIK